MLIYILLGLAILLAVFLIVVARMPSTFGVERSAKMNAPAAAIFEQVNDFHRWEAWSPWAKMDPTAKNTFEGPASGAGAAFAWEGNSKVGQGRMTILESRKPDFIRIRLDFLKPFPSVAHVDFTFKPSGNQTVVTWRMTGERVFMCKMVSVFMNMDKMIGGQYEKGLAAIQGIVEKPC